jgi:hypothetical protein
MGCVIAGDVDAASTREYWDLALFDDHLEMGIQQVFRYYRAAGVAYGEVDGLFEQIMLQDDEASAQVKMWHCWKDSIPVN